MSKRATKIARIIAADCVGCTLCIKACPVEAIIGTVKKMHTVIPELCIGCDLCLPPCPMDCIVMEPVATADFKHEPMITRERVRAKKLRSEQREAEVEAKRAAKRRELAATTDVTNVTTTATGATAKPEISEKRRAILEAIQRVKDKQVKKDQ